MSKTLRICMLNADVPVPNVYAHRAHTYGQIFHDLIKEAASRITPDVIVTSTEYDVREGEYPPTLAAFDAILVTGSANAAYDNLEWINTLDRYILDVYLNHPRIKMFGSCFGHQIICQSLLRGYGGKVEKDPKGYETGVQEITLEPRFRESFDKKMNRTIGVGQKISLPDTMRLQFVHQDHVIVPSLDALPSSWMTLGSTKHCAIQGIYEPGRLLTYQGHFEFDRFVNSETLKFFFALWEPERVEKVLEAVDADDDAALAAEIVLLFLLEENGSLETAAHDRVGGLLTPPSSE